MGDDELLRISDLRIAFPTEGGGRRTAVDGFSLRIRPGERVGLVGESGSGKSVAALAALGLVCEPGELLGGSVTACGVDMINASDAEARRIRGADVGIVFQEAAAVLNPVYTIGFQLSETIRCHRRVSRAEARRQAEQLLTEVALGGADRVLRSYPHQLSGGELQRVMLAVALAGKPRLVIADEPTTLLDLVTQAQILDLLRNLVERQGLALLLISHDLAVVAGMVDRVVVMYAGRTVEEAPTGELFSAPLHPYTRLLLEALDDVDRRLPMPTSQPATAGGCRFASRCQLARPSCTATEPELVAASPNRSVRCPVVLE